MTRTHKAQEAPVSVSTGNPCRFSRCQQQVRAANKSSLLGGEGRTVHAAEEEEGGVSPLCKAGAVVRVIAVLVKGEGRGGGA